MENFIFHNPVKIIFGRGTERETGNHTARYGSRVLLHFGGGSIKRTGLYDVVTRSLQEAGVDTIELGGARPNPRLSLVREGISLCRREGVDFILAVGGGSVIDSAKAIAAGAVSDRDIWDYFANPQLEVPAALPLGVVLTLPATGSEASHKAVITNEELTLKRSIGSMHLIPRFSILNPELSVTLSPYQTACGCSDILSHLMERYFTQTEHVDLTDRLLEAAMKTILWCGPRALETPLDYDVRAEIMWTGTLAHNNLLDTGRISDWASHGIEHELSAEYDLAHGAGLSIITPAWMKYVRRAGMEKFVQFACRVFDVDLDFRNPEQIALEGIGRLEDWYRRMKLPVRLSEVGIGEGDLKRLAERSMVGKSSLGRFKVLTAGDVYEIYRLAL